MDRTIKGLITNLEKYFIEYRSLLNPLKEDISPINKERIFELINAINTVTEIEDEVIEFRLLKILSEEHPYLPVISVTDIERRAKTKDMSLDNSIDSFLRQRRNLIKLLYSTPADYWERTGVHAQEGHISFQEFVRRFVEKDVETLSSVRNKISFS